MKLAIIYLKGLGSFVPGVQSALSRDGTEVRAFEIDDQAGIRAADAWADVVWCEWGNEVAEHAAKLCRRPLVCRVHRYETSLPVFQRIDWSRFRRVIFTSHHIRGRGLKVAPIEPRVAEVIPSGIDLDKFPLQPHGTRPRVGVVGYLHGRKQPGLALQVLAALPDDAELWFAGTPQEAHWPDYLAHLARQLGVFSRVHFDGWVSDVASWWADKDYCLSASCDEGHPYNVIEAMACGVRPVVHEYEGAAAQFPAETLWREVAEAAEQIGAGGQAAPERWRKEVSARGCDLAGQRPQLLQLLAEAAR